MPDWAREAMAQPLSQGVSRMAATKLAGLIHDIGKPDTWIITDEGKHTFIGHDKLGAEMCEPLAKRLKWPKSVERFVEKLVRWHLRPGHLFQQGPPTDKAKYRFYKTIGEELPELIVLALADFRSTCGPGLQDGRRAAEQNLFELLHNFAVFQVSNTKETRFLDGTQLMKLLGIKPSPVVGEILEYLLEAQALGEVKTAEEAASMAHKLYQEKYSR
jgi:putative nucleotidyltransferase with HDIG domain